LKGESDWGGERGKKNNPKKNPRGVLGTSLGRKGFNSGRRLWVNWLMLRLQCEERK